jgi:hypothetical protein
VLLALLLLGLRLNPLTLIGLQVFLSLLSSPPLPRYAFAAFASYLLIKHPANPPQTLTQTTTVPVTQTTTIPVTRFKSVVRPVLATSTATLTVEEETTKTKTVRATATVTTTTTSTETQMETQRARTVQLETQFRTVTEPTTEWITVTVPTTVGAEASPTTRIQVGKDLEHMDVEDLNKVLKDLENLEMKDLPNLHGDTEWADHDVVVDDLVGDIDEDAESVL